MTDQKIEVGSEWVKEEPTPIYKVLGSCRDLTDTPIAVLGYWIPKMQGGAICTQSFHHTFTIPVQSLLESYKPHIREPKVGEVWRVGNTECEIVAPVRANYNGRTEWGTWTRAGYSYLPDWQISKAEYVRQGPL